METGTLSDKVDIEQTPYLNSLSLTSKVTIASDKNILKLSNKSQVSS